MPPITHLCADHELSEGQARGFPAWQVFVLRHEGRLHAWCDAYLNADRSRVVCAAHGALFEPDTGLRVLGPCVGQSLIRVPVEVNVCGGVEIQPNS